MVRNAIFAVHVDNRINLMLRPRSRYYGNSVMVDAGQ